MIAKPKVGMDCWIIEDFWEEFYPIPATIIAEKKNGVFLCRLHITEECGEFYEDVKARELFKTEEKAREAIKKRRRLEEGT